MKYEINIIIKFTKYRYILNSMKSVDVKDWLTFENYKRHF